MPTQQTLNRREFMSMVAAGAGACLVPVGGCPGSDSGPQSATAKRPNIVFMIADDMGWADVGYHGSEIKTPNIDRLAWEGVRFEQHYVAPTCTPTRVGLMSGRYPSRFGVTTPAYGKIFDDDTVTVASALSDCGYDTHISGKWHLGSPPEHTPLKYGFCTSYGYFHGQIDPYTHRYKTGVRSWHRNDQYLDEEGHATNLITNEAIRVIESRHDRPFFLYVAYSVPHYPLYEPEKWTSMYEQIKEPSRRWFAASITHMDDGIGHIVDALDRTGQRRNTLLIFVSDNGGQKSWHSNSQYKGRYADKPHKVMGSNLPSRGWKGQVYEGGIRVPTLANWPGTLEKSKVAGPVHVVDWMPTLCNVAGYPPQDNLSWDGRDIWPLICGQATTTERRTLYWKTPGASAVRHGDWKLIATNKGKTVELYNLADDPYEKQDLAQRHSQRVSDLKLLLTRTAKDDR